METLIVNLAPKATKITIRLRYLPPEKKPRTAREKWQHVLSILVSLSNTELAEVLPELLPQLRADKAGFRHAKHYAGFTIALHLLAKNIGMDLRKF
ncbi:MAG: hypothetical protein ACNA7Y_04050 [Gammaproteobacteria bacterium]